MHQQIRLNDKRRLRTRFNRWFMVISTLISSVLVFSLPQRRHRACNQNHDGPKRLCLLVGSLRITNSCKLTYEGVFRVFHTYSRKSKRIHVTPSPRRCSVEFAEITGCLNGGPRTRIYTCACICTVYLSCTCGLSTCVGIRRTSIRVSRFAIATCSPSCPLFPVRCVQLPCPTNNPIYTPDYSGNRGRFSTLSLPRLPGLLPLSDLPELLFLRACAD